MRQQIFGTSTPWGGVGSEQPVYALHCTALHLSSRLTDSHRGLLSELSWYVQARSEWWCSYEYKTTSTVRHTPSHSPVDLHDVGWGLSRSGQRAGCSCCLFGRGETERGAELGVMRRAYCPGGKEGDLAGRQGEAGDSLLMHLV